MAKRVNNKNLTIDGCKLKALLEETTGKTIRELSLENGYSDSFLRMACKSNTATPSVQTLARIYGINPEAYIVKQTAPEEAKSGEQISIDDYSLIDKDSLKALIKEALLEFLYDTEFRGIYDPITLSYKIAIRKKEVK